MCKIRWLGAGLVWGYVALPAQALTVALSTPQTTWTIIDNQSSDQDPRPGRIRLAKTLDPNGSSPLEISLEVEEIITADSWSLTLPRSAELTNLGEAVPVTLQIQSSALTLGDPLEVSFDYRGQWSDVTDGRQAIAVPSNEWKLKGEGKTFATANLDPVDSLGKVVDFTYQEIFESPTSPQLESQIRWQLGVGDALILKELSIKAQSQGTSWTRWLLPILGLLGFALVGLGVLRRKRT